MLGAPDGRITPRAGLHLVSKLDKLIGITATIDDAGPPFKQRSGGLMLGGVMVSLAETMLAGGGLPLRPRPSARRHCRASTSRRARRAGVHHGDRPGQALRRTDARPHRAGQRQAHQSCLHPVAGEAPGGPRRATSDHRPRPDGHRGLRTDEGRLGLQLPGPARLPPASRGVGRGRMGPRCRLWFG